LDIMQYALRNRVRTHVESKKSEGGFIMNRIGKTLLLLGISSVLFYGASQYVQFIVLA